MSDRSRDSRVTAEDPQGSNFAGIGAPHTSSQAGLPMGDAQLRTGVNLQSIQQARGEDSALRKVGRNDPCSCGSGRKYKRCCLGKDQKAATGRDPEEGRRRAKRDRENARRDERVREGYGLLTRGEQAKAKDFATRWLETYPQDDRFHDILATSCLHLGEFDEAERVSLDRWKAAQEEKQFFLSSGRHSYDDPDVPPGHAYGPEAWLERIWVTRKARSYSVDYPKDPDPEILLLIAELRSADDMNRFPQRQEEGLRARREGLAVPIQAIAEAGPRTLPYLMPLSIQCSWAALLIPEILVHWEDDSSIRALVDLAMFNYPFLSESCLRGLEELGERALPCLKEAFQHEAEFDPLKIGLISVAGQTGTPEALDWVTSLLDHPSPTVVNWTAGVLGRRGHLPALDRLVAAAARVGDQPNIIWAIDKLDRGPGKSS